MTAEPRAELQPLCCHERNFARARLAAADRENAELRAQLRDASDFNRGNCERANRAEMHADGLRRIRDKALAENAELRGEVERLRDLVARQLGDCIGCSPATGPEETCPRDGRTYTEWVEIASMVIGRQHDDAAECDDLRAQLAAAQAQLAEAQEAIDQSAEVMSSLGGALVDAEARLEAVRALHRSDGYARPTCWGCGREWPCPTEEAMRAAALSAAPQPKPDENLPYSGADVESSLGDDLVSPAGVRRAYAERFAPEPPASDETDRKV